jgi:hypothetical protein
MPPRSDWTNWVEVLRRFNLQGLASWLLEAGSPLRLLSAQLLYIGQPFVGGKNIAAIAHMLEDEDETEAFLYYLNNEVAQ